MAQFTVKPINTETPIEAEDRYAQQLSDLNRDITGIRNQLGFKVAASANLRGRLSSISTRVADHRTGMRSMNTALQGAVNTYERTERKLLGRGNEDAAEDIGAALKDVVDDIRDIPRDVMDVIRNVVTEPEKEGFDIFPHLKDTFFDVVGEIGPVGAFGSLILNGGGSLILNGIDGLDTAADWAEFAGDGWDFGWDFGEKAVKGFGNTNWKEWFGAALDKGSSAEKYLKRFAENADDVLTDTFDGFKTAGGLVKEVGGIVLDAIGNGFENMEEYKSGEISKERAIAETVMETAVDWGKDLALAATVGAAVGSIVPGPGTVVGVASGVAVVLVSNAADAVCEWITGKDVTELVSDAILDAEEKRIDFLQEQGRKIADKAGALWSKVSDGWAAAMDNKGWLFG